MADPAEEDPKVDSKGRKFITLDELSKHSDRSDVWMTIHGKVYNVTKYLEDHPGGEEVLLERAGKDATEDYEDVGHSNEARKALNPLEDKPANFSSVYTAACADESMRAKVPVLEVGDTVLIESMVICEYLEELVPGGASAMENANARLFAALAQPALSVIPILKVDAGSTEEAAAITELVAKLQALDQYLVRHGTAEGPFLLGESFSLAECTLAPFAQRFAAVLPGLRPALDPYAMMEAGGLHRLSEWMKAVTARESAVATLPPVDELVDSYGKIIERMKGAAAPA